jgi:predicted nuclease with TOPRIM domain
VGDYGFHIRRLALTGAGLEAAEVEFAAGLNVISGPSDTGKTFILQCIEYGLGASSRPDELPEAEAYDKVVLEIEAVSNGSRYVLERALRGGDVAVTHPDGSTEQLRAKHAAGHTDTVSHFLLQLSGMDGKEVRKNQRGVTRTLSFRDLRKLVVVSEQEVIRESSPLHTGQFTTRTAERSVFRLLLTGRDDSAVVAAEDRRESRVRVEAKSEVLQVILDQLRDQIAEQPFDGDVNSLRNQIDLLDSSYQAVEERLSERGNVMAGFEERRRSLWSRLRDIRGRLDVLSGLSERFSLLAEQYLSDLRRLEAIAEAGSRLGEIGVERCPVCGALPGHHDHEHVDNSAGPDVVTQSATAEANRIRTLMDDLDTTRQEVAIERDGLLSEQEKLQAELAEVTTAIQEELRPRAQESAIELREAASNRQQVQRSLELLERVQTLEQQIQDVQAEDVSSARQEFASLPTSAAEEFAQEVQARLAAWRFPDLDRVTFSDTDWDVVISGRSRTSHGKGVRAVTHAAFTTGLLRYCASRDKPHPGFVLIDSPLVVYREPDPDGVTLDASVKSAFFADLASAFGAEQVILLENDEPPDEVAARDDVNIIRFTKRGDGRYGFISTERS